ncbi:MAG: hypothetical protein KDC59_15685 [Saprospiraceae bacterium]|nr:hypothetical protein [Saprospiraceae bacterium]HPG07781.1 hypothetical protein [Saprospiraceae bacterium]
MLKLLALLVTILSALPVTAQYDYSHPDFIPKMDQHFPGGDSAFLDLVYHNIQYPPEARQRGTMATLLVSLYINAKGGLDSLKFLNPVPIGDGIEEEVLRILKLTHKRWINYGDGFHFDCSFVFKFESEELLHGDISIVAFLVNAKLPRTDLIKSFDKLLKRGNKSNEVKEMVTLLIKMYPDNLQYLELYRQLEIH